MTVRLTIAPGDHYDFEIKPFEAMTVADNIRIYAPMPEGLAPLQEEQEVLQRYSNAPTRYIRYMKMHEVQAVLKHINEVTKAMQASDDALSKVKETLAKWEEEHEGKEWTREGAQEVLKSHGLFRDTITVEGKTFTAPLVEEGDYGQLLDLERQMHASKSEAESYVRALSIMMEGDDGKYPVQRDGESDTAYANRCDALSQERQRLFMAAPWIEVMGIAAFFFLQVPALRRDMRPQYEALEQLVVAQDQAGADRYSERWGPYAELRAAARIKPVLDNIYGPRRDVTEFRAGWVLQELAAQADQDRLTDLVNHRLQKIGQRRT